MEQIRQAEADIDIGDDIDADEQEVARYLAYADDLVWRDRYPH